jgi:hypothetical protein
MFSRVWSSVGYKQWKAILIFIKGLLEDEQGLSMGEMLTMNFVNLAKSLPLMLALIYYSNHWN